MFLSMRTDENQRQPHPIVKDGKKEVRHNPPKEHSSYNDLVGKTFWTFKI